MSKDDAVDRLLMMAAESIEDRDAEFGCVHTFSQARTNVQDRGLGEGPEPIDCTQHEAALEVERLARTLNRPLPVTLRDKDLPSDPFN